VVDESQHREVAARFNAAAEAWWNSVVAEPHSFTKLVYVLGLPGFARPANEPTNVEASGIIQLRRGGSMVLNSIVNYTSVGDFGCWKIRVSITEATGSRHQCGSSSSSSGQQQAACALGAVNTLQFNLCF
jgi:hypothetical protein